MKTTKTLLFAGLALAAADAPAEIYKCQGDAGPVFTSKPGPGCEVQEVNPPTPSAEDLAAAAAARDRRRAEEQKAREAEAERLKALDEQRRADAERRLRELRNQQRREQDEAGKAREDENKLLEMLRGPIP